jgi:hypothetical protein
MKDKKPISAIIMASMGKKPDMKEDESMEGGEEYSIAQDVLDAIASKDKMKLAEALEACFQYHDSQPHDEGEHTNESEEE